MACCWSRTHPVLLRIELGQLHIAGSCDINVSWRAHHHGHFVAGTFHERSLVRSQKTVGCRLVERSGHEVAVVMGSPRNIKITTPGDMELAEFYLQKYGVTVTSNKPSAISYQPSAKP